MKTVQTTANTGAQQTASPPVPETTKLQRRPSAVVLALVLVCLGGLTGLWLWTSSSAATEVVAVRSPVERGQLIVPEDLTTVRVTLDPALRTVPASGLESLVGKRAVTDLAAGTLVAPEQVSDAVVPGAGMAVVAVPIAPGLIPSEPLKAGDTVRLVQAPAQGVEVTGAPAEITGTVLNVTPGDTETVVDVLVADNRAGELAARAASGDLALVLASRER
jgi:flagella basal body P-ring formation protein FlgA